MDSDSEDDYLGDGIPPPVLELITDPTLHVCKIEHTRLGDDGCRRLFRWLKTGIDWMSDEDDNCDNAPRTAGFPRSLLHLELNDVRMGDTGFGYLVDWMRSLLRQDQIRGGVFGRATLKTLILRSNLVQGSSRSAADFVSVSSSLVSLGLSNNPLSPIFRQSLFPLFHRLSSLRLLDLSLTQIDPTGIEALSCYIGDTTTKCKLTHFIANANSMGYAGLKSLISSMESCWTLEKVDMFGNMTTQDANHRPEDIQQNEIDHMRLGEKLQTDFLVSADSTLQLTWGSGCGHAHLDRTVKMILGRNIILKQRVKFQALELLKYSRVMLLKPISSPPSNSTSSCCEDCECLPNPSSELLPRSRNSPKSASFSSLPTELQLTILSELAPILSTTQRIRIFEYSTNKATLPKLRLCLPNTRQTPDPSTSKGCVVDPTRLTFNANVKRSISGHGSRVGMLNPGASEFHQNPARQGGNCMGGDNIVCQRQIEIREWLELVQCDAYDLG